MWTAKTKILYVFYKMFASCLPQSRRLKAAKKLRGFFARRIITHCGKDVNIEHGASFTPGLELGDRSGVGINCEINGRVKIGNCVMMGPEVVVYTKGHAFDSTDIPMMDQGDTDEMPVTIGNDVWLGRRVMIMPVVHIGDGCVIGAGAVVTKDIPAYSVAAGVPAKVVKTRRKTTTNVKEDI